MIGMGDRLGHHWTRLSPRLLPFADAATVELPLGRLLRLSLFQVSVGMAVALLNGTLNRVMIVELAVPAWFVSLMISLPLVLAPARALIGYRSDTHQSLLGWRRVPYIWIGTLLLFGGLAIMPFALILLSGDSTAPAIVGQVAAALAFLLVGAGLHTAQTAGLALAADLAPDQARPRVVALLYVMLLFGLLVSALVIGALLSPFSQIRLIQVIQGAGVLALILNVVALWKQEPRRPHATAGAIRQPFAVSWRRFMNGGRSSRLLVALGLGTAGFSMQDILLEPYGGEILGLSVGATTLLTGLIAGGTLLGFAVAARRLSQGADPFRLAACGILIGLAAFSAVVFSAPLGSASLFRCGTFLIGFGSGLFGVGMLTAAMALAEGRSGLALGAWGAVQAGTAGLAIAAGGFLKDVVSDWALTGRLGPALAEPSTGYGVVYHIEILLLFITLVALGPLVRVAGDETPQHRPFGLAELPS